MLHQTSIETRFGTYHRRESYIWLCVRGDPRVSFGWVLQIREDSILFKDDEFRRPMRIAITDVESCGAV